MSGEKMSNTEKIKFMIWDLDNTIWDGVLLEDEAVTLKTGIVHIHILHRKLQSIYWFYLIIVHMGFLFLYRIHQIIMSHTNCLRN